MKKEKKKVSYTLDRTTPKRTIINVRKAIDARLKQLKKSRLWLAEQMNERPATVYDFLNGHAKVQSDKLELMLGILGMEVRAKD